MTLHRAFEEVIVESREEKYDAYGRLISAGSQDAVLCHVVPLGTSDGETATYDADIRKLKLLTYDIAPFQNTGSDVIVRGEVYHMTNSGFDWSVGRAPIFKARTPMYEVLVEKKGAL